mgnify:CR=1 FL=1
MAISEILNNKVLTIILKTRQNIKIETTHFPEVFSIFRKKVEKKIQIVNCFPIPRKYPKSNLLNIKNETLSLEKLGFKSFKIDTNTAFPFIGGTDNCIERINFYFWKTKKIEYYKQTRNGIKYKEFTCFKFRSMIENSHADIQQATKNDLRVTRLGKILRKTSFI